MLDCILATSETGRNRRHLPNWLRALVTNSFPRYLFRRNVIGPLSGLVVRRVLYPRFDERLRWLIDVDAYVRLLNLSKPLKPCPQVHICSMIDCSDSITSRLGSAISRLDHEERAYLRTVHQDAGPWLGAGPGDSALGVLVRAAETFCWGLMRVLTRIVDLFCRSPFPRAAVREALKSQSRA